MQGVGQEARAGDGAETDRAGCEAQDGGAADHESLVDGNRMSSPLCHARWQVAVRANFGGVENGVPSLSVLCRAAPLMEPPGSLQP
ncbi:hypothetical protein GLI01_30280 [Gluconacetobacter liquefaciens]|nr:hypothetical protein GLI01_30280 [Gluconacetobacter liquefaciens]